jgi:hypothetical protein
MSLTSLLETAAASTAKAEFAQVSETITRLRATLDAYEAVAWKHAERKVIERVFAALGAAPPETGVSERDVGQAREELAKAIFTLTDVIKFDEPESVKVAEPVVVVELTPTPKPAPAQLRTETNPDDVDHARRILDEIEDLRRDSISKPNPLRLLPLLQAIAAESRLLIERLPQHPIQRSLIERMRMVVEIKADAGVTEFIHGLSHTARGDWAQIAKESRKAVARFDVNVAEAVEKAAKKKIEKPKTAPEPVTIKYPLLTGQTRERGPLLLIGGIKVDDKLNIVLRDFGLDCEWVEIPKNAPRAVESTTARIASGKISMAVILEHFMAHTVYRSLTKACDASNVIYATAGKGGKGALDLAFMSLESKLQPR